jgi:hypothetical protein
MDLEMAPFDMLLKEVKFRKKGYVDELRSVVANVFKLWFKKNGIKVSVTASDSIGWEDDCIRVCTKNNPMPIMRIYVHPDTIYPVTLDFGGEDGVAAKGTIAVIKRIGKWVNEPGIRDLLLKEYGEPRHGRNS